MSQLEVDKIIPQSGTTLTIGETGDTISFASGVLPALESLTITGDLTVDTNTLYVDSTNNNVGIGTTSPTVISATGTTLDVVGDAGGFLRIERTNATNPSEGMFRALNGEIRLGAVTNSVLTFRTNNTEKMRIDTSGNVFVGTGDDRTSFLSESNGNVQIENGIIFESGDGAVNNEILTYRTNSLILGTAASEAMRIDSSGNVGIGATSPDELLDVAGNMQVQGSSGTARIYLRDASSGIPRDNYIGMDSYDNLVLAADDGNLGSGSYMGFKVDGTERMRIDSSGNVGIGTTSPLSKLDVFGPSSVTSFTGTSHLGLTVRGSSAATDYSGIDFIGNNQVNPVARIGVLTTGNGTFLSFGTSNNYASGVTNTAMTIDPSGEVGIGTSSPSESLHIASTNGGKIRFGFGGFSIDSGMVSSGNADDYKTSGFYRFNQTVTNNPSAHIYAVVVFGNGTNVVTQIATRIANTLTYVRSFNTSWTSWVRLD